VWIALATGALSAAGAFFLCAYFATQPLRAMCAEPDAELRWLQEEFQLSDAQYARVKALHAAYAPRCNRMCERIAQANARLEALINASREVTPALAAATQEAALTQADCRREMLAHVYEAGEVMSPANRARYLEMMKRCILQPGLPAQTVVSPPR
jgi:small-conductance mechanosensitive channel